MNGTYVRRMMALAVTVLIGAAHPLASCGEGLGPRFVFPGDPAPGVTQPQLETSGRVLSVDSENQSLTIKGTVLQKTFEVLPSTEIIVNGQENAGLIDVRVGEPVRVNYHMEGDTLVAEHIQVGQAKSGEIPISPAHYSPI